MRGWARSICRGCGSDPAWSPPYIAEDAPVDIAVEYKPLPAVIDLERALAPDTVRVHDDVDGNVAARVHQRKGDSDAARQAAALLPHRRFRCDRGAPRRSRCVGWWPSLGDRNFPIAGTASDRFRGNSGRSAGAADRRRRANRGGQRAAQQQEIIALHVRRQSRTAPKCWIGVLRVGGIVHVRQHCASVPPYGLIGRTSSSAPFRFSSVDNRHADEARACRRRRVFERDHFGQKGANRLPPHESGDLRRRQ